MLALAARYKHTTSYAGIDLFEARESNRPGLTFKQAYQRIRPLAGKVKLLPGDPYSALARGANELTGTDLIVVAADQDAESLARAWFYIPRMLHPRSVVLIEERPDNGNTTQLRRIPGDEIQQRAALSAPRRRRAA